MLTTVKVSKKHQANLYVINLCVGVFAENYENKIDFIVTVWETVAPPNFICLSVCVCVCLSVPLLRLISRLLWVGF